MGQLFRSLRYQYLLVNFLTLLVVFSSLIFALNACVKNNETLDNDFKKDNEAVETAVTGDVIILADGIGSSLQNTGVSWYVIPEQELLFVPDGKLLLYHTIGEPQTKINNYMFYPAINIDSNSTECQSTGNLGEKI